MRVLRKTILLIPLIYGCSWMPTQPEQVTNRIVLLEVFGYARCSNCHLAEQQADELSTYYPDSIAVLIYHQSTLGDTLSPQPFTNERADWYEIHEAPTALFDGVSKITGAPGDNEYPTVFNSRRTNPSPIDIGLESSLAGLSGEIHLSTQVIDTLPDDTLKLFTIIFEDSVEFIQSGAHDSIFSHVVRAVLPDMSGIIYQPGLDTTLYFINKWNPEMVGVISFIQNIETKQVLNSSVMKRINPITSFNFFCIEDTAQTITLNSVFAYHFYLQNTGDVEYNYRLDVSIVGDPPVSGWGANFCYQGGCHFIPFSGYITISPGETDTSFTIDTFTGNEAGEITVSFTVGDALTFKTMRVHTYAP